MARKIAASVTLTVGLHHRPGVASPSLSIPAVHFRHPILADATQDGSALLMLRMGLWVAISSCTQLIITQSAIGSGHGSVIQWP